jgi:hypothetical protein
MGGLMTDQPTKRPKLHPAYVPATFDDWFKIYFIGNTSIVGDIEFSEVQDTEGNKFPTVDPYQMLAAAEWLNMKALQQIQQSELAEAKRRMEAAQAQAKKDQLNQIIVTGELPPEGYEGPGVLKTER